MKHELIGEKKLYKPWTTPQYQVLHWFIVDHYSLYSLKYPIDQKD